MKKILAIDDQPDNLITLKAIVKTYLPDCQIITASSGPEGIKLATEEQPDIILLDLNMPKLSGIEFLSILKKDKKFDCIPTIILTTSNNSKDVLKCCETGVAGYIIKPLKYEDYVSKIEKLLAYWTINEMPKK